MTLFNYECKCRKCGGFNEFNFSQEGQMKWIDFATAMTDYIAHPRLLHCDKCNKSTVQDVVSYTDFPGN
jgi:phage FluMu protein Com